MTNRLITIATFGDTMEAQLARGELEAAGIPAVLANDNVTSMWGLPMGIDGIQLQVNESDRQVAKKILNDTSPTDFSDHAEHEPFDASPDDEDEEEEYAEPFNERERNVDRALWAALLSLLFPCAWPYSMYLLLSVYLSQEPLRAEKRRNAIIAAFLNVPPLLWLLILRRTA